MGQFLTPAPIAQFMASMFRKDIAQARLLDAGAGAGVLSAATVQALCRRERKPKSIEIVAFENDEHVLPHLHETMGFCGDACARAGIGFDGIVHNEDFIPAALAQLEASLFAPAHGRFTHAILNPPYKKINGKTETRRQLDAAGMETSNLYAAFVWLAARLLAPSGELVAITPRSFCNGPYFQRFRKALLTLLSLHRVHVFASRKEAFAHDSVLQENIIFHGVRGEDQPEHVRVSISAGPDLSQAAVRSVPFERMVLRDDRDAFIHLLLDEEGDHALAEMARFSTSLRALGLDVSTGRVVAFRAREYLRLDTDKGTAPLVHPCHFDDGFVRWPLTNGKKPNAIVTSKETQDLLLASGYYVLTKRFTAKEERRRLVAAVYDPHRLKASSVGFENHLNYYHSKGSGMSPELAKGLALFLNSTLCDRYFRLFSGHTQVNATDLRKMRYPSRRQLIRLGKHVDAQMPGQEAVDAILAEECEENG